LHAQVVEVRARGSTLAEVSFFFHLRHLYTAVLSDESGTLLVLTYEDYQQLCATYVDDASKAIDVVIGMVQDGGKAGKSQGSRGSAGMDLERSRQTPAVPADGQRVYAIANRDVHACQHSLRGHNGIQCRYFEYLVNCIHQCMISAVLTACV
jgi:hypothetical protein